MTQPSDEVPAVSGESTPDPPHKADVEAAAHRPETDAEYEARLNLLRAALVRYVTKLTRNADQANDIVQEVIIAAVAARIRGKVIRDIVPWLFAVARYKYLAWCKRHKKQPSALDLDDPALAWLAPGSLSIEEMVIGSNVSILVEEILLFLKEFLTERDMYIVRATYWDELSGKEVADCLQVSREVVHQVLSRVRAKARKQYPNKVQD